MRFAFLVRRQVCLFLTVYLNPLLVELRRRSGIFFATRTRTRRGNGHDSITFQNLSALLQLFTQELCGTVSPVRGIAEFLVVAIHVFPREPSVFLDLSRCTCEKLKRFTNSFPPYLSTFDLQRIVHPVHLICRKRCIPGFRHEPVILNIEMISPRNTYWVEQCVAVFCMGWFFAPRAIAILARVKAVVILVGARPMRALRIGMFDPEITTSLCENGRTLQIGFV